MSDTLRLQKGKYTFEQFIRGLSAFRARFVAPGEADKNIGPVVEVPRNEALDAFLAKYPEFTEYREHLTHVRSEQDKFFFIPESWRKLKDEVS